jgi:NMT1-like family
LATRALSSAAGVPWHAFDADAQLLARALRAGRLTALVGAVGVDKTTLLVTGVLPLLRRRLGDQRPGGAPPWMEAAADRRRRLEGRGDGELLHFVDQWNVAPLDSLLRSLNDPPAAGRAGIDLAEAMMPAHLSALSRRHGGARHLFVFNHCDLLREHARHNADLQRFVDAWVAAVQDPDLDAHFLVAVDPPAWQWLEARLAGRPEVELQAFRLQARFGRQVLESMTDGMPGDGVAENQVSPAGFAASLNASLEKIAKLVRVARHPPGDAAASGPSNVEREIQVRQLAEADAKAAAAERDAEAARQAEAERRDEAQRLAHALALAEATASREARARQIAEAAAKAAEAERRAEAQRNAEAAGQVEATRRDEFQRLAHALAAAEATAAREAQARQAAEAAAKAAEAERRAQAQRNAEAARQAEAARGVEAQRHAEAARKAEDARQAEAQQLAQALAAAEATAAREVQARQAAEAATKAARAEHLEAEKRAGEAARAAAKAEARRAAEASLRARDEWAIAIAEMPLPEPGGSDAAGGPIGSAAAPAGPLRPRRLWVAAVLAMLAVVLVAALWWPTRPTPPAAPTASPSAAAAPVSSEAAAPTTTADSASAAAPSLASVSAVDPVRPAGDRYEVLAVSAGGSRARIARELAGALSTGPTVTRAVSLPDGVDPITWLQTPGRLAIVRFDDLRAARGSAASPLRVLAPLFPEEVLFIVRADSPLRYIHELRGRRLGIGPAQGDDSRTVREIYRRLFGTEVFEPAQLDNDQALAELVAFGSIEAMAIVGPLPSAWWASLDQRTAQRLRPLSLDPRRPVDQQLLEGLGSSVARTGAGATNAGRTTTLAMMSFLVASGEGDADVDRLTAMADAWCRELPWLRAHGHAKWRELQPAVQWDTGWPTVRPVQSTIRRCARR